MRQRFLLDTNLLSEPIKARPHAGVLERLRDHDGECATAALVWHELVFGAARLAPSKKRRLIERYLAEVVRPAIPILSYDEGAASWHARERARLVALGRPRPFVDGQIASIAVTQGLILVTRNVDDYTDYADLTVENWFAG